MQTNQIAIVLCCAIATATGLYVFVITTLIPGWSQVSMGDQLIMAAPAGFMCASVVGIMKTI